jgi:hypothetical protein
MQIMDLRTMALLMALMMLTGAAVAQQGDVPDPLEAFYLVSQADFGAAEYENERMGGYTYVSELNDYGGIRRLKPLHIPIR